MSPVRGSGWYKRPYRISYVDSATGRKVTLSFHWRGRRNEVADQLRSYPNAYRELRVWDTGGPTVVRP